MVKSTGEIGGNALTFGSGGASGVVAGGAPGTKGGGTTGPGTGGSACRILCLGQLVPRKGQDVLLRCLARLFDLNWHLTIAGNPNDPVYADGLRALVTELKIGSQVTFHPEATGDTLEALWQGADLFALTSAYEGYGMVWAEALRRGLPVVATNTGAAPVEMVRLAVRRSLKLAKNSRGKPQSPGKKRFRNH